MVFRPAPRRRAPAVPLQPVADPAGWYPHDLQTNDWIYELSQDEIGEITGAISHIERNNLDVLAISRSDITFPKLDASLHALYDELLEGRGFFLLRGLPTAELTKEQIAIAYWLIGIRFGRPLSQNVKGHMIGHVKDFGGDYGDKTVRGYQTSAEMTFHSDQCDYVALLCVSPSKSGGASRIVSTVTIYNEMLKRTPDLAQELMNGFYVANHSELGNTPLSRKPIFAFQDGYFSSRGAGAHIMKVQGRDGVPALTPVQLAALQMYRDMALEFHFDMDFRPGDIQILHNHVTLHTRTAFEDWPEPERKRHLMRLWLAEDHGGRPLLPGFRETLQGIRNEKTVPCVPADAFEPA